MPWNGGARPYRDEDELATRSRPWAPDRSRLGRPNSTDSLVKSRKLRSAPIAEIADAGVDAASAKIRAVLGEGYTGKADEDDSDGR